MPFRPKFHHPKTSPNKMFTYQNVYFPKCLLTKVTFNQNVYYLTKMTFNQTADKKILPTKCLLTKMSTYQNAYLPKCLITQNLLTKIYTYQNFLIQNTL